MRLLPALAFVPPTDVIETFDELTDSVIFPPGAQPGLDYFEDTWVGRPNRRNRRRPPRYQLDLWNCYVSALDCRKRTIHAKAGIAALQNWLPVPIRRFGDLCIEQYFASQLPPQNRKKYRDAAERMGNIVEQYGQVELLEDFRGLKLLNNGHNSNEYI